MKIIAAGATDRGRIRSVNQDCYGLFPDLNLFLVADGMGGHRGGDVASRLAVETIREFILSSSRENITWPFEMRPHLSRAENQLLAAILLANQRILSAGKKDHALTGMGTTIVAAFLDQEKAHIGYVGDSRAYFLTEKEITQLTSDHSLVNDYVKRGFLTLEEAEHHPLKYVLSRALGTDPHCEVDLLTQTLHEGDILLLCTDGLSNALSKWEIWEIVRACREDLYLACRQMIEEVNKKGGEDNITTLLVGAAQ